jgi:hypothetical protein
MLDVNERKNKNNRDDRNAFFLGGGAQCTEWWIIKSNEYIRSLRTKAINNVMKTNDWNTYDIHDINETRVSKMVYQYTSKGRKGDGHLLTWRANNFNPFNWKGSRRCWWHFICWVMSLAYELVVTEEKHNGMDSYITRTSKGLINLMCIKAHYSNYCLH